MSIIPNNSGTAAQMPDGILGVTDGSSAAAGNVGEVISSSASAVSLTTGTAANITSVSLTNGDWDVSWIVGFLPAATTNVTLLTGASSRTSATLPATSTYAIPNSNGELTGQFSQAAAVPANNISISSSTYRFSISAGTITLYLVAKATFTASTMTANGYIQARRIR